MSKRNDYISWDDYFMGVALLSGKRSKDPSTQVGACIVSPDNKILSVGYNGFPQGIPDDALSWEREGRFSETKYPYVCHAELNAILNNPGVFLKNARIYVDLFPCNECCKAIIQSGIREVIYLRDKYKHTEQIQVSKKMMDLAGVRYRQLLSKQRQLILSFDSGEDALP